jgi:GntR family transcriptional regulator, sialic acid-inducible nan operon repressor
MSEQSIPRRKLSHDVQERLVRRIREGEFAPGEALPAERDLMAFYGVGRPSVREALQALARSGIVDICQGERARVARPSADGLMSHLREGAQHLLMMQPGSLEHLKEARVLLEVGLVRIAAERARQDDITHLRQGLQEHRLAQHVPERFLECDMAFHRSIAIISGNPIFPAIVEAVFQWASTYSRSIVRAPGAENLTLEEHERIVDAIARHDAVAAEQTMREHLTRANALYQQMGDGR